MRRLFISGFFFFALSVAAIAGAVRGTLLNDDEPYIVRGDGDTLYKVEWYGGSSLFWEGDDVILTDDFGWGNMVADDNVARVWVEEISPTYSRTRMRALPIPVPSPLPKEVAPPESSTSSSKKFVEDFLTSGNYANPEKEASFYANEVDYFNNGPVTKNFIVSDVARYDKRWTRRTYQLSGEPEITVVDSGRDIAKAVFKFQFTVANGQKTISGSGVNVVLIGNATTNPKVISIKSKILYQHVEPSGG
jgi:hypothetical protein